METSRPTLLIFTLGPSRESARRRLLPRWLSAVEVGVRRTCLDAALAAGREAGCRLEVSSPAPLPLPSGVEGHPQHGEGFGRRLRAAWRGASRRAGGPVVVVGTDVPGLTADHVRGALEGLAAAPGRVVLGPSPDGGVYLLAAAEPVDHVLAGIRWCRSDTLAQLSRAFSVAGFTVVLLEPLGDLDRPADLERWLARRRPLPAAWLGLVATLLRLLAALRNPGAPRLLGHLRPAAVPVRGGRSPPPPRP